MPVRGTPPPSLALQRCGRIELRRAPSTPRPPDPSINRPPSPLEWRYKLAFSFPFLGHQGLREQFSIFRRQAVSADYELARGIRRCAGGGCRCRVYPAWPTRFGRRHSALPTKGGVRVNARFMGNIYSLERHIQRQSTYSCGNRVQLRASCFSHPLCQWVPRGTPQISTRRSRLDASPWDRAAGPCRRFQTIFCHPSLYIIRTEFKCCPQK